MKVKDKYRVTVDEVIGTLGMGTNDSLVNVIFGSFGSFECSKAMCCSPVNCLNKPSVGSSFQLFQHVAHFDVYIVACF